MRIQNMSECVFSRAWSEKKKYLKCAPPWVLSIEISAFPVIWVGCIKIHKKIGDIGEVWEKSDYAKRFALTMRSRKKIIHGARIEISTNIPNIPKYSHFPV